MFFWKALTISFGDLLASIVPLACTTTICLHPNATTLLFGELKQMEVSIIKAYRHFLYWLFHVSQCMSHAQKWKGKMAMEFTIMLKIIL